MGDKTQRESREDKGLQNTRWWFQEILEVSNLSMRNRSTYDLFSPGLQTYQTVFLHSNEPS